MKKTLIIIGGPTASGKTSLAIQIAKKLNTSIISADSRQCYQELNIGVAKPNATELLTVPHYFINTHSIHKACDVAAYEKYALICLKKIFEEKNYAVCAGGTGLYIKALCEGIDEMPVVDKNIKTEIEKSYSENGLEWLQEQLKLHDQQFTIKGEMQNPARMLRALIFKLSIGESIVNYQKKNKAVRDFEIKAFCIDLAREKLYNNINKRVDEMMEMGLLDEVSSLLPYSDLTTLKTVGYTELFDHLNGIVSVEGAVGKIKQHTRNYAKRQLTWFRNDERFEIMTPELIYNQVMQFS